MTMPPPRTDPAAQLALAAQLSQLQGDLAAARATIAAQEHALDQNHEDLTSARATTDALRARVTQLTQETEAAQVAAARAAARPPATGAGTYPDLRSWVDGWLVTHIERDIATKMRWCPWWHEHPEAVWRLTALWQDFDRAWTDPRSGVTGYSRNSLAHHLDQLLSAAGPFSACSPQRHEPPRPLPATQW